MMEKIRKWLRENQQAEHIITRTEHVGWIIYSTGGPKRKAKVITPTVVLTNNVVGRNVVYSRELKKAWLFRKTVGVWMLRWLTWRNKETVDFKLVPVSKAVFITDLTGLMAN